MAAKPEKVKCLICGADMTGESTFALLMHSATYHPVEFFGNPKVTDKLAELNRVFFWLGSELGEKLKGKS